MDILTKYHKLEFNPPNQNFFKYFNNFIAEVKFSIVFTKQKDESYYFINDKTIDNIKTIIYSFNIPDTCSCVCGVGDDVDIILLYKNGNYGYISYHSSCLSYNHYEYESPCFSIEVADSINNLIQYCLPDKSRSYYLQYLQNINQHMHILNLYLPDTINILIVRYILDQMIDSVTVSYDTSYHYKWFLE